MTQPISCANNEYYHIYNRGVDKRRIFLSGTDYQRFLRCLELFNTFDSVSVSSISRNRGKYKKSIQHDKEKNKCNNQMVEIIAYTLMPNHFHLLLCQKKEHGVCEFMRKLGTGYTMYFNLKNKRKGRLFESTYKAKHIDSEIYLTHVSRYIHLNPLELYLPNLQKESKKNIKKGLQLLEQYKWSSYVFYINKAPSNIVSSNILHELFSTPDEYKKFTTSWALRGFEGIDEFLEV